MAFRSLMVAIAMLSIPAGAYAEPAKPAVHDAAQPTNQAPAIEIASADDGSAAAANAQPQPQADPAKPVRHARVSACRCGDQTPGSN